jgi:hypothetical protein
MARASRRASRQQLRQGSLGGARRGQAVPGPVAKLTVDDHYTESGARHGEECVCGGVRVLGAVEGAANPTLNHAAQCTREAHT